MKDAEDIAKLLQFHLRKDKLDGAAYKTMEDAVCGFVSLLREDGCKNIKWAVSRRDDEAYVIMFTLWGLEMHSMGKFSHVIEQTKEFSVYANADCTISVTLTF